MHAEPETSFLANLNQNIGIVHRVCHTYFPRDAEREDVFQGIMYQLWKSYPQFKWASKFSTWIYKVALNTVITHIRTPRNAELTESVARAPDINEHMSREEELHRCTKHWCAEALKAIRWQAFFALSVGCPSLPSILKIGSGSFLRSLISGRSSTISKIPEWPTIRPEMRALEG